MVQINTNTNFKGYIDSRIGGRRENQDSCGYADTPLGLLVVVCDGMGGGPGGKRASSVAVDTIINFVKSCSNDISRTGALSEAISYANNRILNIIKEKPSLKGMGTTVTALLINDFSAIVAHVGDSRVYQFRNKAKKFRTFDHSMVFELVKKHEITEETARISENSNVITRALGHGNDIHADMAELSYEKGDRFMLCTDGIWGAMPEKELIKIAAGTSNMRGAMESLFIKVDEIGHANGGFHDNFSAAMIETKNNSKLKESMSTRAKKLFIWLICLLGASITANIILLSNKGEAAQPGSNGIRVDSVMNVYKDSVKTLNDKMNSLERDTARLNGIIKGTENGMKHKAEVEKERVESQAAVKKSAVLKKLDDIIEQLTQLKKEKPGRQTAILNEITKDVEALEDELRLYGCDTNYANKCIETFKRKRTEELYGKIVGEINILKKKVENNN